MKQTRLWMLAAILLCGTVTIMTATYFEGKKVYPM